MTPLELACDQKQTHLYDMLAPVTLSPVPASVLNALEARFHALIWRDLAGRVDKNKIYLPSLIVLTEIGMESIWFPINLNASGAVRSVHFDANISVLFAKLLRGIHFDWISKIS
jgi:hypothetical protein